MAVAWFRCGYTVMWRASGLFCIWLATGILTQGLLLGVEVLINPGDRYLPAGVYTMVRNYS